MMLQLAKKGGLGAQKVVTEKFSDIEQRAEVLDKEREEATKMRTANALRPMEEPEPEIQG